MELVVASSRNTLPFYRLGVLGPPCRTFAVLQDSGAGYL
jgi:hypothetical protein